MKYYEVKAFARVLRNNPTGAEKKLWKYIRSRQLDGRRFLRQHPIFHQFDLKDLYYFIPDFYCHEEKLIIELDGPIHEYQVEKDSCRQAILERDGYKVIRFKNHELKEISNVLNEISKHFTDQTPPLPFKKRGPGGIG